VTNDSGLAKVGKASGEIPEVTTVLLLDDHWVMLEAVRSLIESDDSLAVVGTASRVPDAIQLARKLQPQVAVIDVRMPDGGGWAAARGLREICPEMRLVAYSAVEDALVTRSIAASGIDAFVPKGSDIQLLLAAIHGENVMPSPEHPRPPVRRMAAPTP
jgi:DNA-binding NarL/FixJ family response regulator